MTDMLYRNFASDLEVRSKGDGRTIYGIAVPWNAPQRIDDRLTEQFRSGAFDHQISAANRVWFSREHVKLGGQIIGRLGVMKNVSDGLYVEMRASNTPVGDETLELVKDGALYQLSIMFRERQNRMIGHITERVTADLREVAVVLEGAYGDLAAAAGVRSASGASADVCVTCGTPTARPNIDRARQVIASLPVLPA